MANRLFTFVLSLLMACAAMAQTVVTFDFNEETGNADPSEKSWDIDGIGVTPANNSRPSDDGKGLIVLMGNTLTILNSHSDYRITKIDLKLFVANRNVRAIGNSEDETPAGTIVYDAQNLAYSITNLKHDYVILKSKVGNMCVASLSVTYGKVDLQSYTITVNSADESMGRVIGGGTYQEGNKTVQAIPNEGYHFKQWSDGNQRNPRTFWLGSNVSYTAQFEKCSYTGKVVANMYKESDATCLHPARYYYICSVCCELGSTTFENGTAIPHKYAGKSLTPTADASGLYSYLCDYGCGTQDGGSKIVKDFTTGNNLILTATDGGGYTASQDIAMSDDCHISGLKVAFTAPNAATYTRSIASTSHWGTLVLPFEAVSDEEEVQLYVLKQVKNNALTFEPVETVAAGTPCVFRKMKDDATSVTITAASKAVTIDTPSAPDAIDGYALRGTYTTLTKQTGRYFIAQDMFWWAESEITIPAYRAYFEGPTPSSDAPLRIVTEDETEGITVVSSEEVGVSRSYDLQGRQIKEGQKGLQIRDGKVVFLR